MSFKSRDTAQVLRFGPLGRDSTQFGNYQNSRKDPSPAAKMPSEPIPLHAGDGDDRVGDAERFRDRSGVFERTDHGNTVTDSMLPQIIIQECNGPIAKYAV